MLSVKARRISPNNYTKKLSDQPEFRIKEWQSLLWLRAAAIGLPSSALDRSRAWSVWTRIPIHLLLPGCEIQYIEGFIDDEDVTRRTAFCASHHGLYVELGTSYRTLSVLHRNHQAQHNGVTNQFVVTKMAGTIFHIVAVRAACGRKDCSMKARLGILLLIFTCIPLCAQTNTFCQLNQQPTVHADKLVCLLPNLGFPPVTSGPDPIGGLDAGIASQASLFPLASPASGIIYTNDPTLRIPVPSGTESFGPVMFERGETLHRGKIFFASTYQFFQFSDIDNVNLKDIPAYFPVANQSLPTYVQTNSRVDLKAHQFGLYATYGLTNRIDVSVALPILNVRLGATSTCQQAAQVGGGTGTCQFQLANGTSATTVTDSSSASGIGDIVFRTKTSLWQGERFRLAAALDLRAPTGDELNFLGTGTSGVRPFLAASWRGRVAPHVDFGYEWNGDSDIASIHGPGISGNLANILFYIVGADARVVKRLTLSGDFMGQHISDALRQGLKTQPDTHFVGIYTYPGSFYSNFATIGGKINPVGNLLLTVNGFFKLDHTGLRNKPAPLVGVSYTF